MTSELAGLGALILAVALSFFIFAVGYIFWQTARSYKFDTDTYESYKLMEILQLNKFALSK